MNFFFFILPLLCSATLLDVKNITKVNTTALISSLADANPEDVMEVRDLVDELIAAGEHDRSVATTARDTAQDVRDNAQTALNDATDDHTQVAGELVAAEQEVSRLEALEAQKRQAKEDSSDAKDDALEALTGAQNHLDTETIRLDEERATLERILDLLDTLLPSNPNDVDCHNYDLVGGNYDLVPRYQESYFVPPQESYLTQMSATNVCQFLGMNKAPEQEETQERNSYRVTIPTGGAQLFPESICGPTYEQSWCSHPSSTSWLEKCELVTQNGVTFCSLTFKRNDNQPVWNKVRCQCTE